MKQQQNRKQKLSLFITTVGIIVTAGISASANDGTPPKIFELIQKGQNVEVTLQIYDGGEPGLENTFQLVRDGADGSNAIFDNRTFTVNEAKSSDEATCRWSEPMSEYCLLDDTFCDDCDGNGYKECFGRCETDADGANICLPCADGGCENGLDCNDDGVNDCVDGWCQQAYYFKMLDVCVDPGSYTYNLSFLYSDQYQPVTSKSKTVTDDGAGCDGDTEDTEEGTPSDMEDTEEGTSSDTENGGDTNATNANSNQESCSTVAVGRHGTLFETIRALLLVL